MQPAVIADEVDEQLRAVGDALLEAAREAKAYGLAAVHIGIVAPVVVISGEQEPRSYRLLFNPRIARVAPETDMGEEGSVSLPGLRIALERPIWAEIAFMDGDGERHETRLEGFEARVAMHEIEQMQGTFFLNRLSRLKREMVLKRARKLAG